MRVPARLGFPSGHPRKHPVSNRTTRSGNAGRQHAAVATPADTADHALADIRAWTQLLVARGNRLLQLADREREDIARERGSLRFKVSDAAPAARVAGRSDRAGRQSTGSHAKSLA